MKRQREMPQALEETTAKLTVVVVEVMEEPRGEGVPQRGGSKCWPAGWPDGSVLAIRWRVVGRKGGVAVEEECAAKVEEEWRWRLVEEELGLLRCLVGVDNGLLPFL